MPVMNMIFGMYHSIFISPSTTKSLVLDYVAYVGFRMSSLRISAAIRLEYLKCLFGQPVSTLDVLPPGQTAAIITITASVLQTGSISEKLSAFLQSISTVIAAFGIAITYSWSLTLVTSSGLVLIMVVYAATTPFLVKRLNDVQYADIQASTVANEILSSMRMIAACGAQGKMAKRYVKWVDESRHRGLKMSPIIALQQALGGITSPLSAAAQAAGAATVFYTIIDAPRPDKTGLKEPDVSATKDLVFQDVNFAYPTRPDLVILNKLSIRFPAGITTAIVGPSGSGKSTVAALLLRFYEIESLESNDMVVGGRPLREIDLKWWRTQIGLVQQEPFLFNSSIYQNVEFGLIGTEWENADLETKKELVKQACKEAFADEFISRLPEGYSTIVGDAGIKLSGGQRQRIAIARSIVKRPKILILDEATSSIDVRGEKAALEKVSKDRTTIVIAHRLGTVKKADNIIVLRKGQAVQQGTHSDLMADEEGAYWTLAAAQKLVMDSTELDELSSDLGDKLEVKECNTPAAKSGSTMITTSASVDEKLQRTGGMRNYMLLLCEQKNHWKWYIVMILSAIGGGGMYTYLGLTFTSNS
ncbi:putative ABC transporter [Copromyces sp. CBS 386.78]|nr:putative ABC transporter [Copromyces sp. CBS 386.78]